MEPKVERLSTSLNVQSCKAKLHLSGFLKHALALWFPIIKYGPITVVPYPFAAATLPWDHNGGACIVNQTIGLRRGALISNSDFASSANNCFAT